MIPGEDGISSFKSIVFIRSDNTPSIPTGGDWESPLPTSTPVWSDGIPVGTAPLYMSTRVFTNTGQPPQQSDWTTPRLASDTPDIDFEYSEVIVIQELLLQILTIGIILLHLILYEWLSERKLLVLGVLDKCLRLKERMVRMENGKDGMGNQMIYKRTTEEVAPTDPY